MTGFVSVIELGISAETFENPILEKKNFALIYM
jgi:hypothetical protein